jgi:hypothetical protein
MRTGRNTISRIRAAFPARSLGLFGTLLALCAQAPPPRAFASCPLIAAGDSLWIFLPESFSATRESDGVSAAAHFARPLPAPATVCCALPGARVAIGTDTGLWLADCSESFSDPKLHRVVPGAQIRSIDHDAHRIFLLIRDPGIPRGPCEVAAVEPSGRNFAHLAEVAADAAQIAFDSADSSIWVMRDLGRRVTKLASGRGGWMADSIDIAAPASAPVYAWNLQWVARSPTLGPLILQQGRGSNPALIALDPPRALWSWPHGATVRDGRCDQAVRTIAINGISELFVFDLDSQETVSWEAPFHAVEIAVSPDGSQLAIVMETAPGRSRVEVRDLVSRSIVRSHVLDASVKALAFLEPVP